VSLSKKWGALPDELWVRGKRILISTPQAKMVWESERSRKAGRVRIPGGRWRPLRLMHLGLKAALLRKGEFDRIVAGASQRLGAELPGVSTVIDSRLFDELLSNGEAKITETRIEESVGGRILIDIANGDCIPVWVGSRLSLMLADSERRILCMQRDLQIKIVEEE